MHCIVSLLHEKAETFFSHTEGTVYIRHSSEYETSDNTNTVLSYSDECRTKTVLSVCEKNVSAFSCYSKV